MSLGLPSSDRNVSGIASLFSTIGTGRGAADSAGASIRSTFRNGQSGLDWARTLRDTTTQQNEILARQRSTSSPQGVTKVRDTATDGSANRADDSSRSRTSDAKEGVSRDDRRASLEARNERLSDRRAGNDNDTDVTDDVRSQTQRQDGTAQIEDNDQAADETAAPDEVASGEVKNEYGDVDETSADDLTLQAAYAQSQAQIAQQSAAQTSEQTAAQNVTQVTNPQATAAESGDGDEPSQAQQTLVKAQLQAGTPEVAGQAVAGAGKAAALQTQNNGDGKAALPAQAANAAAVALQNPQASLSGDSANQQNSQGQQRQHGANQQNAQALHATPGTQHVAASSQTASPVLEIQTSAPGSATPAAATNGQATAQGQPTGAATAMTLPAGADPLLHAQGQDDTDPNVTRIAQGLRSAVNLKGGAVTIRLNPHELGSVRIEMEIKNGNVSAQLQTENASVRDLLSHQLGKLRESLQGRGLHVERLEVNTSSPADGSSAGRHAQESSDQGRSRGQFFQQRGGSSGQDGQGSQQNARNPSDFKSFNDMVVDMVG